MFWCVASAADPAIQKKIYGSAMTILIIWNEEMEDIMEIVIILEESSLLNKGVTRKWKWGKKIKRRIPWYADVYTRCYFIGKYDK